MNKLAELSTFFLGVCITCALFFVLLVGGLVYQDIKYRDRVYPQVAIDGMNVSGKTYTSLKAPYTKLNTSLKDMNVEVYFDSAPFATLSGEMLSARTDGEGVASQAYAMGRTGEFASQIKQKLQMLLRLKKFSFTTAVSYESESLLDIFATLEQQYNIAPENALFELKAGRVTAISREKNGQEISTKDARETLERTLRQSNPLLLARTLEVPQKLVVSAHVVKPSVTLSQANSLGVEELLAEGKSDWTGSIPGRVHNLLLASTRLHGVLIPQGTEFSYNKSIGEISGRTGYQPAYVIIGNRTVLGDGGGVCQTSTTLFRAALNAGLPITQWHAHAYRVHYYENDMKPGMDATVYAPSVDLKFKNDTQGAILIQVISDKENKKLTYQFWGKRDNRKIEISDITLGAKTGAPPARYEDDPTLKKGVVKQVDWAAGGLKTWFDYRVTKGEEIIQERRFSSNYRPWQAVYLVGTQE